MRHLGLVSICSTRQKLQLTQMIARRETMACMGDPTLLAMCIQALLPLCPWIPAKTTLPHRCMDMATMGSWPVSNSSIRIVTGSKSIPSKSIHSRSIRSKIGSNRSSRSIHSRSIRNRNIHSKISRNSSSKSIHSRSIRSNSSSKITISNSKSTPLTHILIMLLWLALVTMSSNCFARRIQYGFSSSAGMTSAPMSDIAQSSYRAASSMSGAMIPPPATAAAFDLPSQSERTSTDMAYYERDSSSMSHGQQQQLQQDVGIHDPLGRLSACRPIISFGFGGKLVTMLPRNVQRFNIYDSGKASKIAPGMLQIQQLSAQISPDLCGQGTLSLANVPLLAGETTRAALLRRRDAAVACANAWLESSRLSPSNTLTQEEEALYRVIIAILGTFDQADVPQQPVILGVLDALRPLFGKSGCGATKNSDFAEPSLPISHGSKQQLENLESLLLAGNRKEAVDTACSQGLWAHALIIASCTGKDLWQSVISAYTECVLGGELSTLGTQYRMFSGLGAGALDEPRSFDKRNQSAPSDEFVAAAAIGGGGSSSISYSSKAEQQQQQHASANGDLTQTSVSSEDKTSDNWAKVLSLMLANRTPGDQAAILALGDRLKKNGRTVEAHICYVLTQQGKDIFMAEGADAEPRAIILGVAETTRTHGNRNHAFDMAVTRYSRYYRKHSAMFVTELYELVFALRAVSAGDSQSAGSTAASSASTAAATGLASGNGPKQPTLLCLPHLQAYKLYYAWWLVDCGQTALRRATATQCSISWLRCPKAQRFRLSTVLWFRSCVTCASDSRVQA
ncbi:Sec23-binding domain of Sec16-domain-containing protein [Kickxella alabastrina]|uniref:Sec23-binding domain of Sec16-domain-containing protein n=1 Tax=Kickxella alabastrina TaxID=61397 RepID=UPI002220CB78|nr:Sec23-binding domain of Sec16-domain-containing protein [Kickxella alabastrina]KAI7825562.1 Sec23-binding domain of Sec16-domain-containing protein [Kickxella alabastrina]